MKLNASLEHIFPTLTEPGFFMAGCDWSKDIPPTPTTITIDEYYLGMVSRREFLKSKVKVIQKKVNKECYEQESA